MLGYFNRFAADDYQILTFLDKMGIWGASKTLYHSWVSYWALCLFTFTFFLVLIKTNSILLYTILLLITLYVAFIRSIRLFTSYNNLTISKNKYFHLSTLFISSLFWLTLDKGQTWFWVSTSIQYTFSAAVAIILITLIIDKRANWIHNIFICILSVYVGGSTIPIFLFYVYLVSIYFIWFRNNITPANTKKLIVSISLFFASLVITLSGEGGYNRLHALAEPSIVTGTKMTFILIYQSLKNFWFEIILLIPISLSFLFLSKMYLSIKKNDRLYPKNLHYKLLILFGSILIINIFPASYILSDVPPSRILAPTYFTFLLILFLFLSFYKRVNQIVLLITTFLFFIYVGYNFITQIEVAKMYAQSHDKRTEQLLELSKLDNKTIVFLPKLPPSGMLYSAEISSDSLHYTNKQLKEYFGVKNNIAIKK